MARQLGVSFLGQESQHLHEIANAASRTPPRARTQATAVLDVESLVVLPSDDQGAFELHVSSPLCRPPVLNTTLFKYRETQSALTTLPNRKQLLRVFASITPSTLAAAPTSCAQDAAVTCISLSLSICEYQVDPSPLPPSGSSSGDACNMG